MARIASWTRLGIAAALLAGSSGCASTQVSGGPEYYGRLPRPTRIVVYPFATSADDIELDDSPTVVAGWKMQGLTASDERREVAHSVASTLADNLVQKIEAMGLPAERYAGQPLSAPFLAITGHFVTIDEGSRMERTVIGLGAGRSDVQTAVQVSEVFPEGRRLVDQFDVVAKSGRKPGAAETLGAGAAAGTLATAAVATAATAVGSEAFGADVQADAKRTGEKVATMLQGFFAQQGWLAQ